MDRQNIKLNTKKIDLLNGDYYNVERTKTGFKVTGLEGKTSLTANDVITSGGELWINGQVIVVNFLIMLNLLHLNVCILINQKI